MIIKKIQFMDFDRTEYPFNISAIKHAKELDLGNKITIFVGENGSGKSTLLKAIAYYNDSINVSSDKIDSIKYTKIKELTKKMRISYSLKTKSGFFFSGEEFITYINNLKDMKEGLTKELIEMQEEFKHKSEYVKSLAFGPIKSQLHALNNKYNGELQQKSHGEGFLSFFKSRMHQKGLYLLDEPETPLSATNQYQLLVLITDLVKNGSQVIIATHSPILMALKDATIYHFDEFSISKVDYDDIESVVFTKHFLNNPSIFLDRL
jgi:predicted ATPase